MGNSLAETISSLREKVDASQSDVNGTANNHPNGPHANRKGQSLRSIKVDRNIDTSEVLMIEPFRSDSQVLWDTLKSFDNQSNRKNSGMVANTPTKRRKKENCTPISPLDSPSRPSPSKKTRSDKSDQEEQSPASVKRTFSDEKTKKDRVNKTRATEGTSGEPRKILTARRRVFEEEEEDASPDGIFRHLFLSPILANCPSGWCPKAHNDTVHGWGKCVGYNELALVQVQGIGLPSFVVRKSVVIDKNMDVKVSVFGQEVKKETLEELEIKTNCSSKEEIDEVLAKIHSCNVCIGAYKYEEEYNTRTLVIKTDSTGKIRSHSCPVLIKDSECAECVKLNRTIAQRLRRARLRLPRTGRSRRTKEDYQRELKNKTAVVKRAKKTLKQLRKSFRNLQRKFKNIKEETLHELLSGDNPQIPKEHATLIEEILKSAKRKSPKGNRFSDDWILTAMLLHTKSSSTYRHLRENNILPLPHPRTIRQYLSKIRITCGFDGNFFKLFAQFLKQQPEKHCHGIITLDEISLKKGITVNSQNLTYVGLQDFGNVKGCPKAENLDDKADHGLVIMFQSLYGNFTQPIAVFASSGPVKGDELAKLVQLAIVNCEHAGAKIHGVVFDGAATNKRMWKTLGCCAKRGEVKNYFQHPLDENRKVFMFSDTPHIIKNIRNRLYDHRVLYVSRSQVLYSLLQMFISLFFPTFLNSLFNFQYPGDHRIQWDHFVAVHEEDKKQSSKGKGKIAKKITDNHLYLSNSGKMRVSYAVQVSFLQRHIFAQSNTLH